MAMMPLWPMAASRRLYIKRHWEEGISGLAVCAEERNLSIYNKKPNVFFLFQGRFIFSEGLL
jgi:hypothetical protein